MKMLPMSKKWARIILIIGDLATLISFVYVGQNDHGTIDAANPAMGVLLASWEFALLWIVVGFPLGAFPRVEEWTSRSLLARAVVTWLVTAPLAILLRFLIQSRWNIATLFLAATLGFGLVFLFVWRLLFFLVWQIVAHR